ncbi:MAG: PAS domain S-box protein [Deltaproteobacteria bacterium]|nr:PAS domain S-box protein [Deltaproteobacteria bacterium]
MARRTGKELERHINDLESEITKLTQLIDTLRENDSFHSNIIHLSIHPILVINPDTSIRYMNPAFETAIGYSSQDLMGQCAPYPWWTTDSAYQSKEVFAKAIQEGQMNQKEDFYQKHDGDRLVVETTSTPIYHNGELLYSIMTWLDITRYKAIETAFQETERRLHLVLQGANISWWDWDIKNNHFVMDKRWLEMVGYEPDEIKPRIQSLRELVHPDDISKVIWTAGDFPRWRTDSYVTEYRLKAKSGEWRWIMVTGNVVETDKNGGPLRATGIHTDISERKKTEQALRDSEERFKAQYQGNPTPIFTWQSRDDGMFLIDYNRAAEKITNGNLKTLLGRSLDEVYPDNLEILDDFKKCFQGKSVIIKDKPTRDFIPGKHVILSYAFAAPDLVMVHTEDISEQVKAEEEKKKLEAQFWQAQKMESLGTLAGGLAHDFNNLLQTIQGNVSLMSFDIQENHPHQKSLRDIEAAVQSGAQLTRQLLGFARGGVSHTKQMDINDPINKTCDIFGRTKKEIQIHKNFGEGVWSVEADPGQIEQVLLNIYINAWQAMPNGGHIHIKTENVTIHESYSRFYRVNPGRYVKVSVTDTGSGMDKETQQRIFEPFFTTKELGRGTGLGLASAYGMIKNHGGVINVYSELGQGATFNIYIPASKKENLASEELQEDILRGSETILLVDDEATVIDVGKKLLHKLGYKVWIVRNGREAVDFIRDRHQSNQKIDLVVLDMIMPYMGGSEVYDQIKKIDPELKVLLSSGYSINGQATRILKKGCNGFIQKPFNMEEFSKKIREILDMK